MTMMDGHTDRTQTHRQGYVIESVKEEGRGVDKIRAYMDLNEEVLTW